MDESQLIEHLDSLWFSSNVLSSSRTQPLSSLIDETKSKESVEGLPSTPLSPILQDESQNDASVELAAEIEAVTVDSCVSEVVEPKKKENKRRRKRSKRPNFGQRRKIVGELDLGFERSVCPGSWERFEYQSQRYGCQQHNMEMPPLSDGLAMKEHLKSWAYAVACTVK
ncbi:hypothetical protein CFOL_v3_01135 [Cephalotus follicularis]|uniref:Uncharacterized protein n=1 Tax=Cephalotus follicularis TaxID=3775 RepID=A0A1Q3APD4_CEPFO|nr:hypothetical protein CFOL_v3_01135 [Cephalotus follicularis]